MERIIALVLFVCFLPLFGVLYFLIKLTSKGPFLFRQKRVGQDFNVFTIYKIRTMTVDAQKKKTSVQHLNEADGPVFKIRNDPRLTKVGRILSKTGLDELSQLINIFKGDMSFVGPRPLPFSEAEKIPKKYTLRFSVKPGITSPWVVEGAHALSFTEWMKSDMLYAKKKNVILDLTILIRTIRLMFGWIWQQMSGKNTM